MPHLHQIRIEEHAVDIISAARNLARDFVPGPHCVLVLKPAPIQQSGSDRVAIHSSRREPASVGACRLDECADSVRQSHNADGLRSTQGRAWLNSAIPYQGDIRDGHFEMAERLVSKTIVLERVLSHSSAVERTTE